MIDNLIWNSATPLALGSATGYGAGWLCRKIIKITIIGIGLILALLAYLEYNKTITVNWNIANNQSSVILHTVSSKMIHVVNIIGSDLNSHAAAFPVLGVAGFVPAFAIGFLRS
jgi:uncharacterized membrane protein (Fun14 family)